MAVERQLLNTIKCLITHGADVNAVADGDVMPLVVADKIPLTSRLRSEIINVLIKR